MSNKIIPKIDENTKFRPLTMIDVEASFRAVVYTDQIISFTRIEKPKFSKLWRDINE